MRSAGRLDFKGSQAQFIDKTRIFDIIIIKSVHELDTENSGERTSIHKISHGKSHFCGENCRFHVQLHDRLPSFTCKIFASGKVSQ